MDTDHLVKQPLTLKEAKQEYQNRLVAKTDLRLAAPPLPTAPPPTTSQSTDPTGPATQTNSPSPRRLGKRLHSSPSMREVPDRAMRMAPSIDATAADATAHRDDTEGEEDSEGEEDAEGKEAPATDDTEAAAGAGTTSAPEDAATADSPAHGDEARGNGPAQADVATIDSSACRGEAEGDESQVGMAAASEDMECATQGEVALAPGDADGAYAPVHEGEAIDELALHDMEVVLGDIKIGNGSWMATLVDDEVGGEGASGDGAGGESATAPEDSCIDDPMV